MRQDLDLRPFDAQDVGSSVGILVLTALAASLGLSGRVLRYRLLHVAAQITTRGRRTQLRIAQNWPWTTDFVAAFEALAVLPRPIT